LLTWTFILNNCFLTLPLLNVCSLRTTDISSLFQNCSSQIWYKIPTAQPSPLNQIKYETSIRDFWDHFDGIIVFLLIIVNSGYQIVRNILLYYESIFKSICMSFCSMKVGTDVMRGSCFVFVKMIEFILFCYDIYILNCPVNFQQKCGKNKKILNN